MKLEEIASRLSKRNTVLPHHYLYASHPGQETSAQIPCIWYRTDEEESVLELNAMQVEETLATIFGSPDFEALNKISPYLSESASREAHGNIWNHWKERVKAYIMDYLEIEQHLKDGYFFMFLPKSI